MTLSLSIKPSYQFLLQTIGAELSAGLISVQKTLEYQRVKTYWTIGKKTRQIVAASQGALKLNAELYNRISVDIDRQLGLDLTSDTVRRSIQFSKAYPKLPQNTPLTFTHYLALMRVTNIKKRYQLEQQVIKEALSSYQLKEKVIRLNSIPAAIYNKNKKILHIERGEPYVYLTHPFEELNGRKSMCVDCGFKIHVPIDGVIIQNAPSFSKNKSRYVRAIKKGDDYDLRLAVRKRGRVYTYASRAMHVVDGDTLDALIDVGFGIRTLVRLRLKAINAPEIKTRAGFKSKQFLTDFLAKSPIIVVRTSKTGSFGRWLADIFILDKCTDPYRIAAEGLSLNQLMLDLGLAVVYE